VQAAVLRVSVLALVALVLAPAPLTAAAGPAPAEAPRPTVYVILWFDTEDYILPASDDAARDVANFLTKEGVRATFKVVGEKARTLLARRRHDVIAALKKHEIGFHANWHSVQPTPAMYLSNLGWDEGVAEFDRREGPGRADVERIFGQAPSCYGQPGSSWGPQSYGAMNKWGMRVYLDAGSHVALDGKPCYYAGVLNLYQLEHTLRADLNDPTKLEAAQARFAQARQKILKEGGGVVSIYYHPCEWVHKEFWDGVNFRRGANPPRERWKLPPQKTDAETKQAYRIFADYLRFLKRFPDVKFITASEAARIYRDRARGKRFGKDDLKAVARAVIAAEEVGFQRVAGGHLTASEALFLLNEYVAAHRAGRPVEHVNLTGTPYGPTGTAPAFAERVTTDDSQFGRTSVDVADFLRKQGRVPSAVWLGSTAVTPEGYLKALAPVALALLEGKGMPATVEVRPAALGAAKYVKADDPRLWGWIIFPPGFRAPALMELAKRQAWALKPATL
jgi:hypothetical protein